MLRDRRSHQGWTRILFINLTELWDRLIRPRLFGAQP